MLPEIWSATDTKTSKKILPLQLHNTKLVTVSGAIALFVTIVI